MKLQNKKQLLLPTLFHKIDGDLIEQRLSDGYINATALCKACNKKFYDYERLQSTKEFLGELSSDAGIPASLLVVSLKGKSSKFSQGTWVHPDVAINLAQWASPKFAVQVSKWVREWLTGKFQQTLPYHLQRYVLNRPNLPYGHFSVFNEVILYLIAPLEDIGYTLPDQLIPDISQGRIFAKFFREELKIEPNEFPTYIHTYPNGRKIEGVKCYPIQYLEVFYTHFHTVWLRERAFSYFLERDKKALPYLDKVLSYLLEPEKIDTLNANFERAINKASRPILPSHETDV